MKTSYPHTANSGPLQITVYEHRFFLGDRSRQAWTYLTLGLSEHGQQELALTLLQEDGDDPNVYPETPVRIFELLAGYAGNGRIVRSGEATRLGRRGPFGYEVLYYLPAIQYPTLPDLKDHLAMLLVHENEYESGRRYGLARLVARLTRLCGCLPYPTWNTRLRPSLFEGDAVEDSVLTETKFSGRLRALLAGDQLCIDPDQLRLGSLQHPQTYLCEVSCNAQGAFYWSPDSRGLITLTSEATHLMLSFVQFRRGVSTRMSLVEDGAIITLSESDLDNVPDGGLPYPAIRWPLQEEPPPPFQFGAGWRIPQEFFGRTWLGQREGNLRLNFVQGNGETDIELSNGVLKQLAGLLRDETASLNLTLALGEGALQVSSTADLNPEFTRFLADRLADVRTDSPFELTIDVNPG